MAALYAAAIGFTLAKLLSISNLHNTHLSVNYIMI